MNRSVMSLIAVAAGILGGYYIGGIWVALIVLGLAIATWFTAGKTGILFAPLLLFSTGWIACLVSLPSVTPSFSGKTSRVTGRVESTVTTTRGERSVIEAYELSNGDGDISECTGLKILVFSDAMVTLEPGDLVRFDAELSRLEGSLSPAMEYRAFADRRKFRIIGREENLRTYSWRVRRMLVSGIDATRLSAETKGILEALLLGDRSGISVRERQRFSDAGVSHIMAVSGMHVALIAGILLFLTKPMLLMRGGYVWRFVLTALFVWIYTLLTGLSYSAVRASIMVTFAMAAYGLSRPADGFSAVCWACTFILVATPLSLWDVGLQLSFLCVLSLTLFVSRLNPVSRETHPRVRRICDIILASLVATGATWPLTSHYFGVVPTQFLLANIVVVPLVPVFVGISLVYLLLAAAGLEIEFFARIIDMWTEALGRFLDGFEGSGIEYSVTVPAMVLWFAGIAALGIGFSGPVFSEDRNRALTLRQSELSPVWIGIAVVLFVASVVML